jgi:hypothetical protein
MAGILAGGSSGIIACSITSAVCGAMMACTHWHEFAHPLGAILVSAIYLGCLSLPVGVLIAVPGGLLLGGLAGYCQAIGKRIWPATITGMAILFALCQILNRWTEATHPHLVFLPGQWQQHLAALAGAALGLAYWSNKHSGRRGHHKD